MEFKPAPIKPTITLAALEKIDIRVGTIISVEDISGSDKLERFTETGANLGSLGVFEAKYLIRHMQANAKMFDKYGA